LPTTEHRQIEGWATVKGEIDSLLERKGFEPPVPRGQEGVVLRDRSGRPFAPSSDARIKRLPRERDRDTSTLRLTKSAASAGRIGHSCGATFQRLGAVNRWRLPPAPGVRPIHRCPKCSTGRSWRRKLRESGNIR
jgi:hypothetical protein